MAKELAEQMTLIYPVDRKAGKVWLARHKSEPFAGKLSGYGGGIDDVRDHSPREGACRELWEEARVKAAIDDLEYLGTICFYRKGKCRLCFLYALPKWHGEFQATAEMEKAQPYSIDALPFDEMTEGDRHWLVEVLTQQPFPHEVYHNDDWTLDRVEHEKVA